MKKYYRSFLLVVLVSIFFLACNDDEPTDITPEITNVTAINHHADGATVPLGGTISVNFDAKTRSGERLDFYHLEIHDHPASGLIEDEYKIIDSSFKNDSTFKGLVNSHVHQHIVVPDTANLGSYHVVVVVVDEAGNSSDTEEMELHIEVVE